MSETATPTKTAPETYILDSLNERDRLYLQFDLFRDDYYRELNRALALGGLPTDPESARWRLLDVCCGEGLYSADLVGQLPQVRVVGFDKDARAIETAAASYEDLGLKFYVQDAHQPIRDAYDQPDGTPGEGFDIAVMWFASAHCHTPLQAFENVFRALKPGGVLLALDPTFRAYVFSHPSMEPLASAFMQTWKTYGNHDAGSKHIDHLTQVGFTQIDSRPHRYPMDISDAQHLKMLTLIVATLAGAKKGIVDISNLMSPESFDQHLQNLRNTCTPEMSGFAEVVITIARKPLAPTAK